MTVYAWPTDAAFKPESIDWALVPNTRAFTSPYTQGVQVVDLLGERWKVNLTLPAQPWAAGDKRAAFFSKLRGGAHQVQLWHFARPVPRGSLRGTPTLASDAAQGADQIVISGVGRNLLQRPSEFDHSYWDKWQTTVTPNAAAGPTGSIDADALIANTNNSTHYVARNFTGAAAGQVTTASVYLKKGNNKTGWLSVYGTGNASHHVVLDFDTGRFWLNTTAEYTSGGGVTTSFGAQSVGNGWWRLWISGYPDAAATNRLFFVFMPNSDGGWGSFAGDGVTPGVYAWGAQLEVGDRLTDFEPGPTLKAGDLLGLGGQLLMVAEDAAGVGDGTVTVKLANRLRSAQSAGAAVIWDRPKATFRLSSDVVPIGYRPGFSDPLALEFVEHWT